MEGVVTGKHVEALGEKPSVADLAACVGLHHHTPVGGREGGWKRGREGGRVGGKEGGRVEEREEQRERGR